MNAPDMSFQPTNSPCARSRDRTPAFIVLGKIAAVLLSATALVGCDARLAFHGTVSSATGRPLGNCSFWFMSWDHKTTESFGPPRFESDSAVSPWQAAHDVTIACDGHVPRVVAVPRGGGDLGNIVLVPADGT